MTRRFHGWRRASAWGIAFTLLIVAAGTSSTGQSPTGASARPPAQEAPLLVMSPKAKSAGWVAISGYGPTKATVIDGGELFGRSR